MRVAQWLECRIIDSCQWYGVRAPLRRSGPRLIFSLGVRLQYRFFLHRTVGWSWRRTGERRKSRCRRKRMRYRRYESDEASLPLRIWIWVFRTGVENERGTMELARTRIWLVVNARAWFADRRPSTVLRGTSRLFSWRERRERFMDGLIMRNLRGDADASRRRPRTRDSLEKRCRLLTGNTRYK